MLCNVFCLLLRSSKGLFSIAPKVWGPGASGLGLRVYGLGFRDTRFAIVAVGFQGHFRLWELQGSLKPKRVEGKPNPKPQTLNPRP